MSSFDRSRNNKAETEEEHFRSFLYFLTSDSEYPFDQGESPDFHIAFSNRKVGVEHVRLYKQRRIAEIESHNDQLLNAICQEAERLELPSLVVFFLFGLDHPISRGRKAEIARQVIHLLRIHIHEEMESITLDAFSVYPAEWPPEIDSAMIHRCPEGIAGDWRWTEAASIDYNTRDPIQELIDKKSILFDKYIAHSDECWLLIVADSFRESGSYLLLLSDIDHLYHSLFARTYFLDFGLGRLHLLSTYV